MKVIKETDQEYDDHQQSPSIKSFINKCEDDNCFTLSQDHFMGTGQTAKFNEDELLGRDLKGSEIGAVKKIEFDLTDSEEEESEGEGEDKQEETKEIEKIMEEEGQD